MAQYHSDQALQALGEIPSYIVFSRKAMENARNATNRWLAARRRNADRYFKAAGRKGGGG